MAELPSGEMTFCFTDIEGSTRLLEQVGDEAFANVLTAHHQLVRQAVAACAGSVVSSEGDAFFAVFSRADAAVGGALAIQHSLAEHVWPAGSAVRVRIGLHTGPGQLGGDNYTGLAVHQAARIAGAAHGGQVLLSSKTAERVGDALPQGVTLLDLGEHRLKDLARPHRLLQVCHSDLTREFPPPRSLEVVRHNLPMHTSTFVGREAELASVLAALQSHRLVTLTGFGGMGKTRLSLHAAAELADGDGDGVWFVDLTGVSNPAAVPGLIGHKTGLGGSDADSVIEAMSGQRLLLVLDNVEQVLGCATFISDLLVRVPGVKILVTSRQPLRLRGERELAVAPLALPPVDGPLDVVSLSAYAAVELFVDRARLVKADFVLNNENSLAVAAICQRLDGHPLALELAAARVRMMTPQSLLPRLDQALSVLTGGGRDLPVRHKTIRATIAWSYDLLEADERLLLNRLSVFAGPVAFGPLEAVCGQDLDVFSALASLVEKSLVRTSLSIEGEDKYGLLVSIKSFALEQLAAAGAVEDLRNRHADHMIEQATLWPPYTATEHLAREQRIDDLFDELSAAWQHVQSQPDDPRVPLFPSAYFDEVFTRTQDNAGLHVLLARSSTATPQLLTALTARINTLNGTFQDVPKELFARLNSVAEELDRPDARFLALAFAHAGNLTPTQRRARVEDLDAMLEQVPEDSPFGRDWLASLRDNMAGVLLQFIDPAAATAAAERRYAGPLGNMLDLSNLALMRLWEGRWQEVLNLTQAAVGGGVTQTWGVETHIAVSTAARALVQLGRPEEALNLLWPWAAEVGRREWQAQIELNACCRSYAMHVLDRAGEAAELFHTLPRPYVMSQTRLMALRVERLAGLGDDPAAAAELVADWHDLRWQLLPAYLAALVEQALRERTPESRRDLLEQIEQHPTPLVLGYGYQADLDRLRGERTSSQPR